MRTSYLKPAILRWLAPSALVVLVLGCNLILAPAKLRNNPLDADNPTPGIIELRAFGYSADSVKVKWQTSTDEDGNTPNVLIIRNSVQEPTTINDGELVYDGPTTIEDGETYAEFTDEELAEDTDYYYGVWSYSDQEGTIAYNGPVIDTATTRVQFVEVQELQDALLYIAAASGPFFAADPPNFTMTYNPGVDEFFYLVWFDFADAPDFGELVSANLVLYRFGSMGGTAMDIYAAQILESWDPAAASGDPPSFYSQVTADGFSTFSDQTSGSTTQVSGFSFAEYEWSVSTAVSSWLVDNDDNWGIILRCPVTNTEQHDFEGATTPIFENRPKLRLQYYGDSPDVQ